MNILVLNAGSSSQKCSLYRFPEGEQAVDYLAPLWTGSIDFSHTEGAADLKVKTASGQSIKKTLPSSESSMPSSESAAAPSLFTSSSTQGLRQRFTLITQLLETLWQGPTQVVPSKNDIHAIGHRVVHGGQFYQSAARVDDALKNTIRDLIPLAPAHNPVNLAGIELAQSLFGPKIPQYAVFDTAFHRTMPEAAALYPVSQSWISKGIRRYGFHGISHQYCAHRAAQQLQRPLDSLRIVVAHLGNGCSLCAVKNGRSVDTTMGFTPLDGLMMGTRSGSVDPGILTYLMREHGYTHQQLDQPLNTASGLKGISGLSSDMRDIVSAMHKGHGPAKLAFEMYVHRLRSGIAAMTASLGGLDALVFTAGVGEHATIVRAEVCAGLSFLGLEISEERNMAPSGESAAGSGGDRDISSAQAVASTLVIHTQEDWQIAKTCWQLQQA